MTTNAQAALQAAATIYAGSNGHANADVILGRAAILKDWLDNADRQNPTRPQGSADRRGTGNRARQCQEISPGIIGSVCYYPAGHDGVHSWQPQP